MKETNELKAYVNNLKEVSAKEWIFAIVIAFIAHGSMLFSKAIGIDLEAAVLGVEAYNEQGRHGIIWIRNLLLMSKFNLYLVTVLTFILLIVVSVNFYAGLSVRFSGLKQTFYPFILFFVTSAYWACQLYFLSQSIPVLFSLLLIPLIVFLIESSIEGRTLKKVLKLLFAAVLFQLVVSTYQINVVIYVAFVCALFFLGVMHKEKELKSQFKTILYHIVFFLLGLIIYYAITKIFYGLSSYVTSQIAWKEVGLMQGLKNVYLVALAAVKGIGLNNHIYVPLCVVTFLVAIYNCVSKKEKFKNVFLPLLSLIGLFLTPFFFPILYGSDVVPRMRYIFPVAGAFVILVFLSELKMLKETIKKEKAETIIRRVLLSVFGLILFVDVMKNFNYSNFLYYTNEYRYEQEYLAGRDIKRDLDQYFYDNNLSEDERNFVIFRGEINIDYNNMSYPGLATIGSSSINWDSYFMVRTRIYKFLTAIGYPIGDAPYFSEGAETAYNLYFDEYFGKEVDEMPSYPYKGYIKEVRDDELGLHYIVVKLGDKR